VFGYSNNVFGYSNWRRGEVSAARRRVAPAA
jgi:hypothetical protein